MYHYTNISFSRNKLGSLLDKFNAFHRLQKSWTMTYVTISGAIGIIHEITENDYESLLAVQQKLVSIMPSIGCLSYASWREVRIGNKINQSENFLDGDLLEKYLNLTPIEKSRIVEGLPCTVKQLELKINCLSRLR